MGRAVTRLAAFGAAVAGVVFFWRKKHPAAGAPTTSPITPPTASDKP